ncbi:hypothetical protein N1F89_07780 [Aquibium sp. A9E412]|uniref:hypothetical protein n=1 Tax=Aquibium sp. A9E412 TaxID=2976767 RepID=UPI0025B15FF1|nr:hypothetical protein [Aquibium sp. A9E412]MDN2566118.1 hypothetical protein [Aquibium sp. A9E412]
MALLLLALLAAVSTVPAAAPGDAAASPAAGPASHLGHRGTAGGAAHCPLVQPCGHALAPMPRSGGPAGPAGRAARPASARAQDLRPASLAPDPPVPRTG